MVSKFFKRFYRLAIFAQCFSVKMCSVFNKRPYDSFGNNGIHAIHDFDRIFSTRCTGKIYFARNHVELLRK